MSGGGNKVYIPQYTGTMVLTYTNPKLTGGYAEFTSSGTLTWAGEIPRQTDLFCVGGGGAGAWAAEHTAFAVAAAVAVVTPRPCLLQSCRQA